MRSTVYNLLRPEAIESKYMLATQLGAGLLSIAANFE